jgi:prepilin-type N-terminal cleavage/methylation domain-containing protein
MPSFLKSKLNNHSFTLIELLIVIAILALLMSIIIITLNPSELLKQTRDTKRISNLKSLNNALSIYQATKPTSNMGTSSTVYISIPDSDASCTNLSLPTLPDGYTYACATTANYKKTDGTGWIPVNFDSLDIGSPLSSLPIDPTNTTSTNLFYTYTTGGSWELNALLESSKQKLSGGDDKTSVDGGDSYSTFEIGTDLSLSPYKDTGLVGYWKFDEGVGTTTKDDAASNTGTITGATWKSESDCASGNCLYFDGTDYVATPSFALTGTVLTVSGWVKMGSNETIHQTIISGSTASATIGYIRFNRIAATNGLYWYYADNVASARSLNMSTFFTGYDNMWTYITLVSDYSGASVKFYRNGELIQTSPMVNTPIFPSTDFVKYLGSYSGGTGIVNGNLDDIRIYNRELSASEIKAIYEGTK